MAISSPSSCSSDCSPYMFHDIEHPVSLFFVFNKMRENKQLFDVSLRAGNIVMKAHKLVLALSSQYFYVMFNSNMADTSQLEIKLHDMDSDALHLLVDFSYTSKVEITHENVKKLFSASSYLVIDSVRDACYTFLLQNICPTNCLSTWQLAKTHSYNKLSTQSHDYALQHFEAVAESEEFLCLSFSEIESLVSDDKLSVESETQVFVAVMLWVKYDLHKRFHYKTKLMRHIRFAQMSKEFLFDVVYTEPLVNNEVSCNKLLLDALKYQQFPERRSDFLNKQTQQRTGGQIL